MTPGKAYFIVRAEVPDPADRAAFDRWYASEHLPQAVAGFAAERGWRGWSRLDPAVHFAFYEFPDLARAQAILGSPALAALVTEFDRAWGKRVARTREIIEIAAPA
jgi:hypothetical protein